MSKRAATPPVPAALAPHVAALREFIMPAASAARAKELDAIGAERNLTRAERRELVTIYDDASDRADNAGRWIGSRLYDGLLASQTAYLRALDFGGNWNNVDVPALVRGLLALIDGSDVPPTEVETRENPHWSVSFGGCAIVVLFLSDGRVMIEDSEYPWGCEEALRRITPGRWVPLNHRDHFRPMPRPVVPR